MREERSHKSPIRAPRLSAPDDASTISPIEPRRRRARHMGRACHTGLPGWFPAGVPCRHSPRSRSHARNAPQKTPPTRRETGQLRARDRATRFAEASAMPWVSLIPRRQSGRARPPVSNGWSRADAAEFRHHARQPGQPQLLSRPRQ